MMRYDDEETRRRAAETAAAALLLSDCHSGYRTLFCNGLTAENTASAGVAMD